MIQDPIPNLITAQWRNNEALANWEEVIRRKRVAAEAAMAAASGTATPCLRCANNSAWILCSCTKWCSKNLCLHFPSDTEDSGWKDCPIPTFDPEVRVRPTVLQSRYDKHVPTEEEQADEG